MTERVQQEQQPTLADLAGIALAGNLAGINPDYLAASLYEAQARIASLEAELERAQEALRRHGEHDRGCPYARLSDPGDCSCGFLTALGLSVSPQPQQENR